MKYALTLEHDTKPTITVRGATEDLSEATALNKALREAERLYPRFAWTSFCFVVEKPRIARRPAWEPVFGLRGVPAFE